MRGFKILITGPTGQVAAPIAKALAPDNEVWGIARFSDSAAREQLEKAGNWLPSGESRRGRLLGDPTSTTC